MSWLVSTALRFRIVVLALSVLLIVYGVRTLQNTRLDVFPEFAPPMVEIQTEAPGLSTEEVESLVTVPVETAVNGIPGRVTLRSKSVLGLSSVQILFDRGADMIRARQMAAERIAQVQPRLPLAARQDRKSTRLNSSHVKISYAVFCLKKKKKQVALHNA